jgi:hypothetical protein
MDLFEQINGFVSSGYFMWIVYGVLIYLGVLWFALVAWVARDVVSRSRSLLFQTLMILMNMALPIFGLFVYLLLRPSKTLMAKYYDEVEMRLLKEAALASESDEIEVDIPEKKKGKIKKKKR